MLRRGMVDTFQGLPFPLSVIPDTVGIRECDPIGAIMDAGDHRPRFAHRKEHAAGDLST